MTEVGITHFSIMVIQFSKACIYQGLASVKWKSHTNVEIGVLKIQLKLSFFKVPNMKIQHENIIYFVDRTGIVGDAAWVS